MIFGNKVTLDSDFDICVNDVHLPCVCETKFLGVIITENLKWNKHVDMVTNKVSKVVGIFT